MTATISRPTESPTASSTPIVFRGLRDGRRGVLGYGIGLGLMINWVMAIYPSVEGELAAYVDAMPDAMKALFGMDDLTSLAGFVHAEIFSLMGPLVFIALAVSRGSATIAGEERDRWLPIVLSTGLGRRRVVAAKAVTIALELLAVGAIVVISLAIGTVIAGGGLSFAASLAATAQLIMLGWFFGSLALAVGAATGSRGLAAAGAAGFALVGYLVDGLANIVTWLEPFEVLSPFHWYAPSNPLVDGMSVGGAVLLVAGSVLAVAVAAATFERRDVHI